MSRDRQRLLDYLAHILGAITRIGRYIEDLFEIVWKTIERDLPMLESMVDKLFQEMKEHNLRF